MLCTPAAIIVKRQAPLVGVVIVEFFPALLPVPMCFKMPTEQTEATKKKDRGYHASRRASSNPEFSCGILMFSCSLAHRSYRVATCPDS